MAKKSKKNGKSSEGEKEIFEVEDKKTHKEKEIMKDSHPKEEHASKEELKKQHNQLKVILWVLGALVVFFIFIMVFLKVTRTAHYDGVKFEVVQEGELIFYNTKVPLYDGNDNHVADYNFYLRTEPRILKKIPFEGELDLKKGYVLNLTEEFNCDGDATIGLANLVKQYQVAGMVFINDSSASCDPENRYNYFEIKSGDETKIVQRGNNSCYDIYVNNCEILKATEKLMAESFVIIDDLTIRIS